MRNITPPPPEKNVNNSIIKKSLFLSFIFVISFYVGFKITDCIKEKPSVHIYMDIASTPSFLQMVDFIKVPRQDKKYIAWRRFPNRGKFFDLNSFNTQEIKMPVYESACQETYSALDEALPEIVEQNPEVQFIIHGNLRHPYYTVMPALKHIPPSRIKEIHLYEDGIGNLYEVWRAYATSEYNWSEACVQHIKDFQNKKIDSLQLQDMFCLYKLYPTIYHVSLIDMLKKENDFKKFFENLSERIVEIDFRKIAKELSPSEKELLYAMVGFNEKQYKETTNGKKTLYYTLGWLQERSDNLLLVEIFNELKNNELKRLSDNPDTVLFFKAHPATAAKSMKDELLKDNKDAIIFPRDIPFEILIIADLTPDYILGFSSTLFFFVEPEKILYYLTKNGDKNLQALKKLNIISEEKILDIQNFIK